ncbi:cytochrome c oxidase assembly protein [Roseomonas marmotae]|uniref:Cytochrome c oxidase assembly protein CtaG n=1 Tax=Roseomonas marmotae TaxID=2768161 RepID=A0ABS3KFY9_9PROT|nr:cytochrome c oxidase assembly protein [Roseomonas marmotae]MBO1076387.1 cytochrome c oxidase assembly protein [Roseomonas marmotae]QTI79404.1 cytochrome c oxidase assembly protein [Roseomonas marmotae]
MPVTDPDLARRNRRTATIAGGVVAGMVGLAFASVPLYAIFCAVTGYGGTPQIGGTAPGATDQMVTVRFNANVSPNLPWKFAPSQGPAKLALGEEGMAFYHAENLAETPVTGIATYNVTPEVAGAYFHKVACFCFDEQTLEPGQKVEMPIAYWVSPEMAKDPNTRGIKTITVNYTYFRTLADAERAGALAKAGEHVGKRTELAEPGRPRTAMP